MSYRVGASFERYLVRKFREQGLMAWRTPASQSPVDLIIYNPEDKTWLLVQVKK
jgi:SinI restriction endonuclease.